MPSPEEIHQDKVLLARLDRGTSSLPFVLTKHAVGRLDQRFRLASVEELQASLLVSTRVSDTAEGVERWIGNLAEDSYVALVHIDEEKATRVVRTILYRTPPAFTLARPRAEPPRRRFRRDREAAR